jgi:mannose-6-phosphate isomerase-like protein (cupin superfamily)
MAKIVQAGDLPRAVSLRDGRQRIDLVTEKIFGTLDVMADRVTYQPGRDAPAHYHTGSRHYFFIISGAGAFQGENIEFRLAPGDVVMSEAGEMHSFTSDPGVSLEFIELWVPAPIETIWADPEDACRWSPVEQVGAVTI